MVDSSLGMQGVDEYLRTEMSINFHGLFDVILAMYKHCLKLCNKLSSKQLTALAPLYIYIIFTLKLNH